LDRGGWGWRSRYLRGGILRGFTPLPSPPPQGGRGQLLLPAVGFDPGGVDVVGQRLEGGEGALFGEAHGIVDLGLDAVLDGVELFLWETGAEQRCLEALDRVTLAPLGHLGLVAVELRVGHRMAAEAVGERLHERWPLAAANRAQRPVDVLPHPEQVHAVDLL